MTKTTYKATFSNGDVITRKTERIYSHAWQIIYTARGETQVKTGFARTEKLARVCQSKEDPADFIRGRWVADPSRFISFEVVPVTEG